MHYGTMKIEEIRFGVGPFRFGVTPAEWDALKKRFTRNPIYHGPCLIIDRNTGLALDATLEPGKGTAPVLWTPHTAPWQQWRLESAGRGLVRIVSDSSKLALTGTERPNDGSRVWLDQQSAKAQKWHLKKSDDNVAFIVEHARTPYSLDAGTEAKNEDEPHLWATHWAPWQQWIICRLPLA
jgi:Ricin-type beta-trefoil lectin domain